MNRCINGLATLIRYKDYFILYKLNQTKRKLNILHSQYLGRKCTIYRCLLTRVNTLETKHLIKDKRDFSLNKEEVSGALKIRCNKEKKKDFIK